MSVTADTLPWYVEVLGGPIDAPGVARLVAEYELVDEPYGSSRWLENMRRGFSIGCGKNEVETIHLVSNEVEGAVGFRDPLPLGLAFTETREDVLRRLGPADHETGPRGGDEAYGHAGILRYDLGGCWLAIELSAKSGSIRSLILESRACASRFVGR